MVDWKDGWMADKSVGKTVELSAVQSVVLSVETTVDWLVDLMVARLDKLKVVKSDELMAVLLVDWWVEMLVGSSADLLVDLMADQKESWMAGL